MSCLPNPPNPTIITITTTTVALPLTLSRKNPGQYPSYLSASWVLVECCRCFDIQFFFSGFYQSTPPPPPLSVHPPILPFSRLELFRGGLNNVVSQQKSSSSFGTSISSYRSALHTFYVASIVIIIIIILAVFFFGFSSSGNDIMCFMANDDSVGIIMNEPRERASWQES